MPPSARITFRLTPTLEALVSDRVRQGSNVSDIVREALETYFGLRQTPCPTNGTSVSDSTLQISDISAKVSDVMSDVSDMRERLMQLETRLDELSSGVRQPPPPRPTPRQTPQPTPATAPRLDELPAHIQRIAETAMQYDKLSLADLSQLLFDRQIYRAKDRQSGTDKPVNRGTLQKWLAQARRAGVL
jgi:DNA repair ATPase RecN